MKNRHSFVPYLLIIFFTITAISCENKESESEKPNIIYILADDMGYGDLGCYGQKLIQTPNIDRLAAEGMLFTQHYSGGTVCAPSRSSLLTGQHTGNTFIRGNRSTTEGGRDLPSDVVTVAEILKEVGYTTGAFGKWGLGMMDTPGHPNKQGFDEFFGYLSQGRAHRYYPDYLIHNDEEYPLEGNDLINTVTYSQDVIQQKTLEFISNNKANPFFLYVPHLIPHAELAVPDDSIFHIYDGQFEETPWGFNPSNNMYSGNDYGASNFHIAGYAPVEKPRATFAAMISRIDHHVGEILSLLEELGISKNTLVIFTSDNGPHIEGGADPDFFNSNDPFRGYKRDLYEGGIRVPMIAHWPGQIKEGTVSDHISAFWDVMPTLAEITGANLPDNTDGISFLPTLTGKKEQMQHNYMYWEFHEMSGKLAVRKGKWKAVRNDVFNDRVSGIELYDLSTDPGESINLADEFPDLINEMREVMKTARTEAPEYDFPVKW